MDWLFGWIKKVGAREAIKRLDQAEPVIAAKLREAQARLQSIPPDQFAKELVDEIQLKLCEHLGVDPKDIGLEVQP